MPLGFLIVFAAGFLLAWFIMRTPRVKDVSSVAQTPPATAPRHDGDQEIEGLLRDGKRIEAIARYREIHACDIATAVRMIETLEQIQRL